MVVYLVAVGRIKHSGLRDACDDFAERLRRRQRLEIVEVRAAGRPERDRARARKIEADALLAALPPSSRVIALTRDGAAESSEQFAQRLRDWREDARDVALLIGGAFGLDRRVLELSHDRFSLSRLTLPHELARLVLLEQLYRADTILHGEPYHKRESRR